MNRADPFVTWSAFFALLLGLASPVAALDLDGFVGSWRGQGELRDTSTDTVRRVQCALDGTRTETMSLMLTLRCASRQGARTITIDIAQSEGGAVEAVRVDLPGVARAEGYEARLTETRIVLGHPMRGSLVLERSLDAGLTMTLADVAEASGKIKLR